MLDFDVQILRTLRSEEFGAPFIRAHVGSINLSGSPSQVLLSFVFGVRGATRLVFVHCRVLLDDPEGSFLLLEDLNPGLPFFSFN